MISTIGIESTNPKTMPEAHAALPVWNAENWFFEDFAIGHKIRSLRRTISEGESMQFNALVLDMHPYVGDQRRKACSAAGWWRVPSCFRPGSGW